MKGPLDMLRYYWEKIPTPIRTIINVGVSGALVFFFTAVVSANGVTSLDWVQVGSDTLDAFGLGIATAALRALNPLDSAYGWGKPKPVSADEIPGDH